VGGSARFFCEAFVGKKDLADIAISIRWYHVTDDNQDRQISEDLQEIVKREEEQIIGSYLTIPHVTVEHYGRYMCRVEMGNSQSHRLEMSAELINALAIKADGNSILVNPYFLASCAAIITVLLLAVGVLAKRRFSEKSSNKLGVFEEKAQRFQHSPSSRRGKSSQDLGLTSTNTKFSVFYISEGN
jgi:Immunoglobulin domain